jgi:hypothetical protein
MASPWSAPGKVPIPIIADTDLGQRHMSTLHPFAIELDADLAARLIKAAGERGWSPESLVVDCVAQNIEIALRHRVLVERIVIGADSRAGVASEWGIAGLDRRGQFFFVGGIPRV